MSNDNCIMNALGQLEFVSDEWDDEVTVVQVVDYDWLRDCCTVNPRETVRELRVAVAVDPDEVKIDTALSESDAEELRLIDEMLVLDMHDFEVDVAFCDD